MWTSLFMELRYNRAEATTKTTSDPLNQPDLILILPACDISLHEDGEGGGSFPVNQVITIFDTSPHPLHVHTHTTLLPTIAVLSDILKLTPHSEFLFFLFSGFSLPDHTWDARCTPLTAVTSGHRKPEVGSGLKYEDMRLLLLLQHSCKPSADSISVKSFLRFDQAVIKENCADKIFFYNSVHVFLVSAHVCGFLLQNVINHKHKKIYMTKHSKKKRETAATF